MWDWEIYPPSSLQGGIVQSREEIFGGGGRRHLPIFDPLFFRTIVLYDAFVPSFIVPRCAKLDMRGIECYTIS